jgi:hypothetical protein
MSSGCNDATVHISNVSYLVKIVMPFRKNAKTEILGPDMDLVILNCDGLTHISKH